MHVFLLNLEGNLIRAFQPNLVANLPPPFFLFKDHHPKSSSIVFFDRRSPGDGEQRCKGGLAREAYHQNGGGAEEGGEFQRGSPRVQPVVHKCSTVPGEQVGEVQRQEMRACVWTHRVYFRETRRAWPRINSRRRRGLQRRPPYERIELGLNGRCRPSAAEESETVLDGGAALPVPEGRRAARRRRACDSEADQRTDGRGGPHERSSEEPFAETPAEHAPEGGAEFPPGWELSARKTNETVALDQ